MIHPKLKQVQNPIPMVGFNPSQHAQVEQQYNRAKEVEYYNPSN